MDGTQPDGGPGWLVRPARAADADALGVFLTGLSLRTRYLRFFAGVLPVSPAFLRRMTGGVMASGGPVDALVVTECGADGPVIGHGMASDSRDDAGLPVTELGVVVADEHRGRGAGSALIRTLTARAQDRGAATILMEVLAENREMLALIAHYFPAARYSRTGPYVSVHVSLPAPFPVVPGPAPQPPPQEEQSREPSISAGDAGDIAGIADADLSVG